MKRLDVKRLKKGGGGNKINEGISKKVIGLTIEEAKKIHGKIRVVSKDGQQCMVTMDYRTDRMNVNVKNGKIVSVSKWG